MMQSFMLIKLVLPGVFIFISSAIASFPDISASPVIVKSGTRGRNPKNLKFKQRY